MATNGNGNGFAKFTPGAVAEVIALAGPGEEVPSTNPAWGPRMRYQLTDGRSWYAPLGVETKLQNLKLAFGEPFRVCLRPFGQAGHTVIDVLRCPPEAAPGSTPAPLAAPTPIRSSPLSDDSTGSALEEKLKASIAAAKRPPQPPPPPQQQAAPAAPDPTPHQLPPAPYLMTGTGQAVLQHYTDAIDIVMAARHYAKVCGLDLGPTSFEDVRCIAATSRINAQGGR